MERPVVIGKNDAKAQNRIGKLAREADMVGAVPLSAGGFDLILLSGTSDGARTSRFRFLTMPSERLLLASPIEKKANVSVIDKCLAGGVPHHFFMPRWRKRFLLTFGLLFIDPTSPANLGIGKSKYRDAYLSGQALVDGSKIMTSPLPLTPGLREVDLLVSACFNTRVRENPDLLGLGIVKAITNQPDAVLLHEIGEKQSEQMGLVGNYGPLTGPVAALLLSWVACSGFLAFGTMGHDNRMFEWGKSWCSVGRAFLERCLSSPEIERVILSAGFGGIHAEEFESATGWMLSLSGFDGGIHDFADALRVRRAMDGSSSGDIPSRDVFM